MTFKLFFAIMPFLPLIVFHPSLPAQESPGFSLTVRVDGLRNSEGVIQFALYNQEGSIPDERFEKCWQIKTGVIVKSTSEVVFDNLPKGAYAVNILHDENKNGRIDKGLIFPKEGIGFSNYKSIGLRNKPNFDKASFEMKTDTIISVKIIYM